MAFFRKVTNWVLSLFAKRRKFDFDSIYDELDKESEKIVLRYISSS